MIIDGNHIATEVRHELEQELGRLNLNLTLLILQVGEHAASTQYIKKKIAYARELMINAELRRYDESITNEALRHEIFTTISDWRYDPYSFSGMIVQLPLPPHIDRTRVLNEIPQEHDVDLLSEESEDAFARGRSPILPPVIGAMAEILARNQVSIQGKRAVVIGRGKLVGKPAALWLRGQGADVQIAGIDTPDLSLLTKDADIIISGTGSPKIIKPEMIQEGVVLIDAGTSESEGKTSGDADPACAKKCSIFTPVPGGVGPITVGMLFKNLVTLAKASNQL